MTNKRILIGGLLIVALLTAWMFYPRSSGNDTGNFHRTIESTNFALQKRINTNRIIISLLHSQGSIFMDRMIDAVRINKDGSTADTYSVTDTRYLTNNMIIGFDADSTGLLFQDANTRTLTKIRFDKTIAYQRKLNRPLLRSVYLQGDSFLLKTSRLADNYRNDIFSVYNSADSTASVIDTLLPHYGNGGMATDGMFIKSSNGKVAHLYFYMSRIFVFDKTGKPILQFNTLDGSNTPPPVIQTSAGYATSPESKIIHSAAFAEGDSLYICSTVRSPDISRQGYDHNYLIDVYNLRTGVYEKTLLLPKEHDNRLSNLLVQDNAVYAVEKNQFLNIYTR